MESSLAVIREIITSLPATTKHYGYGTAGFRDKYTESIHVVFVKVGILAALRSLTVQGAAIGVMVTASHNPKEDNGVKIVDPDGGMLTRTWETAAEELVNADVDNFFSKLTQFIQEKSISPLQKKPLVVVGSDCRDHSPILTEFVKKGVEAVLEGICINVGNVTTPLLHYVVASVNNENSFNPTKFNREKFFNLYFDELHSGFADLVETSDHKSDSKKSKVILDTAYGVGSVTTAQFLDYIEAKGLDAWEIEIRNKVGEGPVNEDCGAEHCQKLQIPCAGVSSDRDHSQLLCSFDGDADRIVFHAFLSSNPASWVLLDGDRIAALIANFLFAELTHAEIIDKIDMGVVQTAYANGSSTLFLKEKGVQIYITKTGVKYLHHKAHELDVGIYFEANGHGTVLFSEKFRQLLQAESEKPTENERKKLAIRRLKASLRVVNPTVGDALSDMLFSLAILTVFGMDYSTWNDIYTELPSKQVKVAVSDKSKLICSEDETHLLSPQSLQDQLNQAMQTAKHGRIFIRPSGTEDVVRIYAEASTKEEVNSLVELSKNALSAFFASLA